MNWRDWRDWRSWQADIESLSHRIRRWAEAQPKPLRICIAIALIILGTPPINIILPVVGIWMVPLGLVILAVDVPWIGRQWGAAKQRWQKRQGRAAPAGGGQGPPAISDQSGAPPGRDR